MKPGIYDMPAADYHKLPFLSSSLAQIIIAQSPLHAWTACAALNPNYSDDEKEEFDIGSAAHALLLEGQDRMVIVPFDNYKKKEAQELRDAARAVGKHPVLSKRYDDVMHMRDVAVRKIVECEELGIGSLATGSPEQVVIWRDKHTDELCRARVDWLCADGSLILDYKSTKDATPDTFSRHIARMGYHYQDEFYTQGVGAQLGKRPRFVFMAQETVAPYAVSFHGLAPSLRAVAEADLSYAFSEWARCRKSNRWPDHSLRIHWAEAMPWQVDRTVERAEAHGIPFDPAVLYAGANA